MSEINFNPKNNGQIDLTYNNIIVNENKDKPNNIEV